MGFEWDGNKWDAGCVSVSVNQCLARKMSCKTGMAIAVVWRDIFISTGQTKTTT